MSSFYSQATYYQINDYEKCFEFFISNIKVSYDFTRKFHVSFQMRKFY